MVTAAAVIMISVFAAFIAEPNSFIKSIGFALAAAVFFDAFVVRMVMIPSVMALLGDKAWWLPKWLDKILPNVDIEGEKLQQGPPREKDASARTLPISLTHLPRFVNGDGCPGIELIQRTCQLRIGNLRSPC